MSYFPVILHVLINSLIISGQSPEDIEDSTLVLFPRDYLWLDYTRRKSLCSSCFLFGHVCMTLKSDI